MLAVSRMDRTRGVEFRGVIDVVATKPEEEARLRWFERVKRRKSGYLAGRMLIYKGAGRRPEQIGKLCRTRVIEK